MGPLISFNLDRDQDVVEARRIAAAIATLLDFDAPDQMRISTAVSEIARNAFQYAVAGWVEFGVEIDARPQRLVVCVKDDGPGVDRLDDVLNGQYLSPTGLGRGIRGARRLMDGFFIDSSPAGTRVILEKLLPASGPVLTIDRVREIGQAIRRRLPGEPEEDGRRQSQELAEALDELELKRRELAHLNRELEATNRGVAALYAELDERADHLRRADELKSRFLSNVTHEFRTPVNAIIGLCNLMLDDRREEQREPEPELGHILRAADQLSGLVNDLLDLAKVAAGKTVVQPADFEIDELFGALRVMLRPLLFDQSVALVFDDAAAIAPLYTDEAKVSQILRNLISNALKFTERGEVRVSVATDEPAGTITFTVSDTGIGIAAEDQEAIFEEFKQLEHRLQRRVRGTGLGLPLARRLAELLGGSLTLTSEPGVGSAFSVTLPMTHVAAESSAAVETTAGLGTLSPLGVGEPPAVRFAGESTPVRVLAIDDQDLARHVIRRCLPAPAFDVSEASDAEEGLRRARAELPDVILLDLVMPGMTGRDALQQLQADPSTRHIPVVIATGAALEEADKHSLLQHAAGLLFKASLSRHSVQDAVRTALARTI
jgi:signal transduction histidine kinase/CheY-like chemotaxis protein